MTVNAKHILRLLGGGAVEGVGSAIGEETYHKIKEFILNRPESEKKSLLAKTSFNKPNTFFAMELERLSSRTASYLLSIPSHERSRLIELAKQGPAGNEEQTLSNLIRIVQSKS
jgi:hypothetical protein